jgi:hypothetical protein
VVSLGAKVAPGNEPYYVHGAGDSKALELTPVAFRFTPVGAASRTIDDGYVDPKRRS